MSHLKKKKRNGRKPENPSVSSNRPVTVYLYFIRNVPTPVAHGGFTHRLPRLTYSNHDFADRSRLTEKQL